MSMSMPRAGPPPVSHLSMSSGSDSRYNSMGGTGPGTPDDVPYNGGPYEAARPAGTSPPSSIHPGSFSDSSRPSGSGASSGQRPPSSASSVGMLSADGRRGPMNRDSSRSQIRPEGEEALSRHYVALKSYLSLQLHDEKGQIKPNRARDKLLRLSSTQFMELSTDVYDELIRREDERLQRLDNPPRFLLPKQNFHPKRNQARQKLSTLPIERFRQLATDVFFELERRIPRFVGGADRPMSSTSSGSRAPSRGGMRPPPPFGQNGRPRMGPNGPMSPYYPPGSPGMPPGNRRPSEAGSMGRPLPKTFQSSTIVPNKSTMVEDDEGDDDYTHDRTHSGGSFADRAKLEAQEAEITVLKEKLEDLETKLSDGGNSDQWASLREELEQKVLDAQALNEKLQSEIDQLRQGSSGRSIEELEEHNRELQAKLADDNAKAAYGDRMELLEEEIAKQETMMNEVRLEATNYLKEMRDLSRQHDQAIEQEERLATRVKQLEKENSEWRSRYAKIKAQNKSLRASTMGLGLSTELDHSSLLRQEGIISEGGLIRDTDVTRYQLAVESLLHVARGDSTSEMLTSVKNVVVSVSSLTAAVGTDGYPTPSPSPLGPNDGPQHPAPSVAKIKARVTGTANSLITATKQHAAAHGLSPVVLLDAAASNLTAAVVQLIKAVRIRPSSRSELHDIEAADEIQSLYGEDDDRIPQHTVDAHDTHLHTIHHDPPTATREDEEEEDDHFNAYSPDAVEPIDPSPSLLQLQPKAYQPRPSSSRSSKRNTNTSSRSSSRPPPLPEKDVPSPALSHAPSSTVTTPNPAKKVNGGWFAWGKRGDSPDSSADGSVDGYDDHTVSVVGTAATTSIDTVAAPPHPPNGLQTLTASQYKPYSPGGARA